METSEQEHVAVDVTASFKPAAKGRTQGTERPSESDVPQRPPSCRKVLLDWTQHPPRSPRSRSRPYSSLHPPALRSAEFAATDPTWSAASPTAPAHFTTLSGPRQCQRLCPRRSNSDPHPAAECRLAQLRQAQVRSRVMIELVEIHPVMAGRWSSLSRSVRNCRVEDVLSLAEGRQGLSRPKFAVPQSEVVFRCPIVILQLLFSRLA